MNQTAHKKVICIIICELRSHFDEEQGFALGAFEGALDRRKVDEICIVCENVTTQGHMIITEALGRGQVVVLPA